MKPLLRNLRDAEHRLTQVERSRDKLNCMVHRQRLLVRKALRKVCREQSRRSALRSL